MVALVLALSLVSRRAHAEPDAPCADLVPTSKARLAPRPLNPEDLLSLRDIGPVDGTSFDTRLFTISPDGKRIAFQLRRADPARNGYCLAMVVLALEPGATPRVVDAGGELLRIHFDFSDKADFPTGVARPITPRWSADGRWIAFLKRENGRTQVWRANADGSGSAPLTHSETDIEDFRFASDGHSLIFSSRPALDAARRAIEREGLAGYHYDDRFASVSSDRPYPVAPIARIVLAQNLASDAVRSPTDAETALLPASPVTEVAWAEARGPRDRKAWLAVPSATFYPGIGRIMADDGNGRPASCDAPACADARRPWWTAAGHVRFLHSEGWARGSTAIYDWVPGAATPHRLYVTDDLLADCQTVGDSLLCLREASLQPRRLERLDPANGTRSVVFDPNPQFQDLMLGRAERLHLRNAFGVASIADLVLPVGYRPGTRYPLVVVQYDTRGFLRGGTGDDYPIQAFATRGYAVLSVSRPKITGASAGTTDVMQLEKGNLASFAYRRSELASIEAGVQLLVDRGIADPKRVGLTGMSDGATVAAYAVLHSDRFAAIAMSNCCFDTTFPATVGPSAARHFYAVGYPKMTDDGDAFWQQISLSRNARTIETPILLQVSDDEYADALETYTALRECDAPIDMFVFPDEHHVKWQPAHRLAIYQRSLDWFDFWLKGQASSARDRHADISRWESLRAAIPAALRK